jgi:seryl-tRNA synthetase
MIDVKWIRQNAQALDKNLLWRGQEPVADEINALDQERRELLAMLQGLQHARKVKAQALSLVVDKNSLEFQTLREDAAHINEKIAEIEKLIEKENKLERLLENLPNILSPQVPQGLDESLNEVVRISDKKPDRSRGQRHHQDIASSLGMFDTKQTAMISGSRFATLSKGVARLERALANFMLDYHTQQLGFVEVSPPYLVKDLAMYNVGLLPKFSQDSFKVAGDFRLIPTAEVSLTNLVADTILAREELPIRLVAYSPCFRSEAGSAGRDSRGLIRMHQFHKVELVSITTPDESEKEHEYITSAAEAILKMLDLPYRIMLLCSGDTGFQSSKTYDLEVWMPAQSQYREISSCSNCTDFQARRMKARYKEFNALETTFVHTLNGSALAIGRTIAAILENYQNADGSVTVPSCLVSYMDGVTKIESVATKSTIF